MRGRGIGALGAGGAASGVSRYGRGIGASVTGAGSSGGSVLWATLESVPGTMLGSVFGEASATSGLPSDTPGNGALGMAGGAIGVPWSGIGGTSETWVRGKAPGGTGGGMLAGLLRAPKFGGGRVLGRSAGKGGGVGIPATALIAARGNGVGGRVGITGRSIGSNPPVPPWSGVAS